MNGKFITFEGGEGAGKATQIHLLAEELKKKGYSVVLTKEPGQTYVGKKIRELLLSPDTKNLCPEAETLLFFAARAQNVKDVILPALESGNIVICDRFTDSTAVYQGYAKGVDLKIIKKLHKFASGIDPDLTIVLDVEPEIGLDRTPKNEFGKTDRFESQKIEFHKKIIEGYRNIAKKNKKRAKLIPLGAIEKVHAEVMKLVLKLLE
jgi:dTMP kinase